MKLQDCHSKFETTTPTNKSKTMMAKKSKESGVIKSEGPSRVLQKIFRPAHFDVIFGKGKPFQMHSGNRRMHRIASMHKAHYLASKQDKILIADMVLQQIKTGGSEPVRFLKRGGDDGELWVEVNDYEAREKVRHALRFTKTKTKKTEASDEVTEQETASASLPGNQHSMPAVETPSMVASSHIPRHSLNSLRNHEALVSAPVLPVVRSINPAFLPAAALPWCPSLRVHGGRLSHVGVRTPVTRYPLPPTTMSGMPYGMVGPPVVSPRIHFSATPVGLLTDAQILEVLIRRRQGMAYVRGRPQFP
jgi:hypothetical protein